MNTSATPMTLLSWIHDVLQRKGVNTPTGQPLYQYQVDGNEYERLKQMLKQMGRPAVPRKNKAWCAAFCLFSAEWYRREYIQGWSWEGIWKSLDFELDANERGDVVYKGLTEFWKRPLSTYQSDRNSYLGSAFSEGGLPFSLIVQQDNRIINIFRRILKSYDDVKAMGEAPSNFVATQLSVLPEAFKKDTTVDLVVNMIEMILYLTDKYHLDEQINVIEHLDLEVPDWRKRFPIPMEEQTGNDFLNNLLKSASQQRKENQKKQARLSVEHWLSNKADLSIVAKISLAKLFDISIEQSDLVSNRVEVFIQEGRRTRQELSVGHVTIESEKRYVNLRTPVCEFSRVNPNESLSIVVTQVGKMLYREEIPSSEIQLGEIPVVISKKSGKDIILGSGSLSSRAEQLSVILPENAKIESHDGEIIDVTSLGEFGLIGFRGILNVLLDTEQGEDSYVISTGSNSDLSEKITVEGKYLDFLTKSGQPIYLGVPKLRCSDFSVQQWVGGDIVGPESTTSTYGTQTVKLKNNSGATLYHKRFSILPEDFSIKLESGLTAREGYIHVTSKKRLSIGLNQDSISVNSIAVEGGKRLCVASAGAPPNQIILSVRANLEALPIEIAVPFPSSGVLAFNATGDELPRELTVVDLLGSRLQLFPVAVGNAHYSIALRAPGVLRDIVSAWDFLVGKKPLEVSLYDFRHRIQEFLAASGDLDAKVSLEISGDCQTRQYSIGRYSALGNNSDKGVEIVDLYHLDRVAKPILLNLADPGSSPRALNPRTSQGVKTGFYEFERAFETPGLIVPAEGSDLSFRAKFVPGTKQAINEDRIETLNKAVTVYHPDSNPNSILSVLNIMANDFNHSSWNFISTLFSNFSYLPLATFEVWKSAVKNEKFLAALALRIENSNEIMQALQEEFNVLWDLVAIESWRISIYQYKEYMLSKGFPEEIVETLFSSKVKILSIYSRLFSKESIKQLEHKIDFTNTVEMNGYFAVIPVWSQELFRQNSEEVHWPDLFIKKMQNIVLNNVPDLVNYSIPLDYQKAVVYSPYIAALVVTGKITLLDIFSGHESDYFKFKQIVEFDRHWFDSVFQAVVDILLSKEYS